MPLAAVLALVALLFAGSGCGGDDAADSETDPQELLEQTFGGEGEVDSGVLDISVEASAGSGAQAGSIDGSVSGPFVTTDEASLPLIDLAASLQVNAANTDESFEGAITITEDGAFVETGGQAYEADEASFATLEDAFAQSAEQQDEEAADSSAIFSQLGIDPAGWITDVTNEGTEEVGGAETVHISGTADVERIVADAQRLDPTGETAGIEELTGSVSNATVDVYTGAEDKILRRLDLSLELEDPRSGEAGSFSLSIGVSDVNGEQEIAPPENPRPLEELLPGGLGGISAPGAPGAGAGGGGSGGGTGGGDAFSQCVEAAGEDPALLQQCAALL